MNAISEEIRGRLNNTRFAFAIEVNKSFAGICALYDVNGTIGTAKSYYRVAVELRNRKIATKALQQLIIFAKKEAGIKLLKTGVLEMEVEF